MAEMTQLVAGNGGLNAANPWLSMGEDTGGYDEANFYTRATDHHGHGEIMRFKVPPDVYAEPGHGARGQSRRLPDPADFVRDAIVHLLRWPGQLGSPRLRKGRGGPHAVAGARRAAPQAGGGRADGGMNEIDGTHGDLVSLMRLRPDGQHSRQL